MKEYKHGTSQERAEMKKAIKRVNQRLAEIEYNPKYAEMKNMNFYKQAQTLHYKYKEGKNAFMKTTTNKLGEHVVRFRTDLQNLSSKAIQKMMLQVDSLLKYKTSTYTGTRTLNNKAYMTFKSNHPDYDGTFSDYLDMWSYIDREGLLKYGSGEAIKIVSQKPDDVDSSEWAELNREIYDKYQSTRARQKMVEKTAQERGLHLKSKRKR